MSEGPFFHKLLNFKFWLSQIKKLKLEKSVLQRVEDSFLKSMFKVWHRIHLFHLLLLVFSILMNLVSKGPKSMLNWMPMKVFSVLSTWLKATHYGIILWVKLLNLAKLLTGQSIPSLVEMKLILLRLLSTTILPIEAHQLSNCRSKLLINQLLQLQRTRLQEHFQTQFNNLCLKRPIKNTLNKMVVSLIHHTQLHLREILNKWPKNSQKSKERPLYPI